MMSNNPFSVPGRDDGTLDPADPTKKIDGERVLDPDANDDLVDSAEADRVAAGADEDDDDR